MLSVSSLLCKQRWVLSCSSIYYPSHPFYTHSSIVTLNLPTSERNTADQTWVPGLFSSPTFWFIKLINAVNLDLEFLTNVNKNPHTSIISLVEFVFFPKNNWLLTIKYSTQRSGQLLQQVAAKRENVRWAQNSKTAGRSEDPADGGCRPWIDTQSWAVFEACFWRPVTS